MTIAIHSSAGQFRKAMLAFPYLLFFPGDVLAQGLPVETGSPIPVAIWFAGAAVLGLVWLTASCATGDVPPQTKR
jgi:hypothetical protein